MTDYISALVLIVLVLLSIELKKSYHAVPRKELKYRATHGDQLADKLYRAAAYGMTLDIFLWLIIVLGASISFVLFSRVAPFWISLVAVILVLWIAFAWLPRTRATNFGGRLALLLTPAISKLLQLLHPLFNKVYKMATNEHVSHTRVYDKSDLTNLIDRQKSQHDSRISDSELDIMHNSLKLFDTKVSAVSLGWSRVKTATPSDAIGPILLDELHKSRQSFIPVFEGKNNLVGILNLNKLDIGTTGLIRDVMDSSVYFINEDDQLSDALRAFSVTNSPVLIVVDSKERYCGLLVIGDVINELLESSETGIERYASMARAASKNENQKDEVSIDQLDEDDIMSITI